MDTRIKIALALILGLGAGAAGSWYALSRLGHDATGSAPPAAASGERKVLYWYDPMVPDQHFDKPGKSPFMDMDLVPKYADEAGTAGVAIDPRTLQNLGVRTAVAERGRLWRRIDTVGYVRNDENRVAVLQARSEGWIERLHVRALNETVRAGQLIAEVYSPTLYAAQEEYLLALRQNEDAAWRQAARQKLSFLGLAEAQIARLEREGRAQRRVAYYAPIAGVVTELPAKEGAAISAGMPMLTLADLSRVWVTAEVVEDQGAWIAPGKSVEVKLASLPGEVFEGKVDYVYPAVNPETRTHSLRIVLANPGLRLKPGMYANVTVFGGKGEEAVLVPSEAVIQTGQRALVLVAQGEGRYAPVAVKTGMESEGKTAILAGLSGGEQVVTSGQFLIESEANLRGALARLGEPQAKAAGSQEKNAEVYTGRGRIEQVDAKTGELEMTHEPIPALKWPAMTMGFEVREAKMLQGLKHGQSVDFDMVREGEGFVVVAIRPTRINRGGDGK
jgi:Cu(I)/Ag(I) efflux system membrane fusion protein